MTIAHLPCEVISKIFVHAKSDNTFDDSTPQWVVGMVSRNWRDVSLGTAQLWNEVKLISDSRTKPSRRRPPMSQCRAMLEAILRRSDRKILHVDLDVTNFYPYTLQPFLSLLFNTSNTWKTLALRNARYNRSEWEIEWNPLGFPSLQAITINDLGTFAQPQRLLSALENSLKLKSVALFHRSFKCSPPSPILPGLPYHQLTLLELDPPQELWCLQALERCTNLSTLIIRRDVDLAPGSVSPSDPVTLPAVRRLQLLLERNGALRLSESTPNILDLLSLPSLTQILVSEISSSLIRLIDRSGCSTSLQSVSIRNIALRDYTIERLLSKTPNVTTLSLRGPLFARIFTSIDGDEAFLPNLRHLSVSHPVMYSAFPSPYTLQAIMDVMDTYTLESLHLVVHTKSVDQGLVEKIKREARCKVLVDYRTDLVLNRDGGRDSDLTTDSDDSEWEEHRRSRALSAPHSTSCFTYGHRRARPPKSRSHTQVRPIVQLLHQFVWEEAQGIIAENLPLLGDILTVIDGSVMDYSDCAYNLRRLQSSVNWNAYPWNGVPHIREKLVALLERL
ncbi:hypothetical protein AAF712_010826 [Marasmius tenuissimus]|uniref:F-box domain-containing protein n=1 Tax=Marasmius tenuissimus TaxID=585030 RepID=A0ABR2ZKZ9_9AGAR